MKKKDLRKKEIKRRKNFFPTLIVILLLWALIASLVYLADPFTPGAIPSFFLLAFLSTLFTAATIFTNTRRGFLVAVGLTAFLILRYLGVGNLINFLLIIGVIISAELYFSKS